MVTIVEESPEAPQTSKFGSFDDSLMIATLRAGYLDTARLLKESGDQQAAKVRIDKSVAAAKAVKSKGLGKMMLYRKVIGQLTALGENAAAGELIQRQDTPYMQATSSADVAAALILDGKVDEGLKLASESVADRSQASRTRRVAIALLTVKRYDELGRYMAQMPDSKQEVRAFRGIAQEMVKTGNIEQLNALIDRLPSDAARTQACLGAHDVLGQSQ